MKAFHTQIAKHIKDFSKLFALINSKSTLPIFSAKGFPKSFNNHSAATL